MPVPASANVLATLRRGLNDPWFLLLLPLAVLIFCLLLGYHAGDPGWVSSGTSAEVHHFAGKFGAYAADLLLSFLGYAAYLLPLGLVAIAWTSAKRDYNGGEPVVWKSIALVGALLSLCVILTFHWHSAINSVAITGGGIIGQKIAATALNWLSVAAVMLICSAVFVIALSQLFGINWWLLFAAIGYFPAKLLRNLLAMNRERREKALQPRPAPEQSQSRRESILSRLTPQNREKAAAGTAGDSAAADDAFNNTFTPSAKTGPALGGAAFTADSSSEKKTSLAEHLSALSAKPAAAKSEPAAEAAPGHRSEPALSWADYKREAQSSPPLSQPAPKDEAEPVRNAPLINPRAAEQNPFAAFDAFSDHAGTNERAPAEKSLMDVIDEEDSFFTQELAEEFSAPAAPAKAQDGAAAPRIRLAHNHFHGGAAEAGQYRLPDLSLLNISPPKRTPDSASQFRLLAPLVEAALQNYRLDVRVVGVDVGPVVMRLELELAPGIKVNQLSNLDKDLARSLSVPSVRVVEVIPGKPYVGLEIPNKQREVVHLREILESATYQKERSPLTVVLGADIAGAPKVADLAKMPHLLVAGTTGSGKSVAINVMLASMLFKATPDELKLILIDPKMLEMSMYEDIPHLLTPVVTDMNDAENALRWAVAEMERRYMLMSAFKVRNIIGFNDIIRDKQARGERIDDPLWRAEDHLGLANQPPQIDTLPYIVIVIDELADMMMAVGKKVEELIARIAQKARAAGIHLVLATQRPSVDVITGLIKANVPTRLAFQVSSKIDSRTIIDGQGAEALLGHGDGLYVPPGSSAPLRVHGAFIADGEVDALTAYLKTQGRPQYEESITNPVPASSLGAFGAQEKSDDPENDPLYDEACQIVLESGKTSISYLQRRLQIGYNRAARIIEAMEIAGLLSMADNNGARKIIGGGQQDY